MPFSSRLILLLFTSNIYDRQDWHIFRRMPENLSKWLHFVSFPVALLIFLTGNGNAGNMISQKGKPKL